jgi:predicted HTH domain antitoxin
LLYFFRYVVCPEEFKNEMRLAAAAVWYEQGKVSQEMAVKIAGMNRTDFLLALARRGKDSLLRVPREEDMACLL